MAGAALSDSRRLMDELTALRGGQAAGGAAAATKAVDLRQQLDLTRWPPPVSCNHRQWLLAGVLC